MIEYQVINHLIFQPKYMSSVLKRTVGMRRFFQASIYNLNLMSLEKVRSKLCLSRLWCIHYTGMIHFSEHVKLVELETLQVIVGSYGWFPIPWWG